LTIILLLSAQDEGIIMYLPNAG